MGTAENARHANDCVDYIFRDRAHVERFANRCKGYRENKRHPMAEKYLAILADVPQLAGGSQTRLSAGNPQPP
jgi:hypothetical protein